MSNYYDEAISDAMETTRYFLDEMIEQRQDSGSISDDLFNDYSGVDSYHHENHVDRSYRLSEAADLLEELSEYEETDSGLWEGLDPRTAVSAQAAYTYGNAVLSKWKDYIDILNEHLDNITFMEEEGEGEEYQHAFINLFLSAHVELTASSWCEWQDFVNKVLHDVENGDFDSLLIFCDQLEEKGELQRFVKEMREKYQTLQNSKEEMITEEE